MTLFNIVNLATILLLELIYFSLTTRSGHVPVFRSQGTVSYANGSEGKQPV